MKEELLRQIQEWRQEQDRLEELIEANYRKIDELDENTQIGDCNEEYKTDSLY